MTVYRGYEVTAVFYRHCWWQWTVRQNNQIISRGAGHMYEEEAIATAHRAIDALLNPNIHEVFRRRED